MPSPTLVGHLFKMQKGFLNPFDGPRFYFVGTGHNKTVILLTQPTKLLKAGFRRY